MNAHQLTIPRLDTPPTLGSAAWDALSSHDMTLDAEKAAEGLAPREPGRFRMAHDDQAIYLRVDFTDRDVCTTATADHEILYQSGDVAEWFIGTPPQVDPGTGDLMPGAYLELHVAPNGLRSAYRIIRPELIETLDPLPFTAEARIDGTLNEPTDQDRSWSAQFTLPWASLRALPGAAAVEPLHLSTLVARYNYGRHLPYQDHGAAGPELTMWPTQPKTAFHLRPFHAPLIFQD